MATPELLAALRKEQVDTHTPVRARQDPTTEVEDGTPEEVAGTTHAADAKSHVTIKNVWQNRESHPVVLNILMCKKYEHDWMFWEPETVIAHIEQDFSSNISDINLTKLQAMRSLQLVDSFWERWEVFNICTSGLNGLFPDGETLQVPTVLHCMVAVDTAQRTRADLAYSEEIERWLAAVHVHEQVCVPQTPLDFVKIDLSAYPVDAAAIRLRWPFVRHSGVHPSGATVEDQQLSHMLDLYQGLQRVQTELRLQLSLVNYV